MIKQWILKKQVFYSKTLSSQKVSVSMVKHGILKKQVFHGETLNPEKASVSW